MIKNKRFYLSLLIPVFLGFCAFIAVVGFAPLMPTNLDLAQGVDPFKDYIAWVFYRHGPWTFPIGLNPSYGLDFSNSIVFSDSIPLMAFIFKVFRFALPETFQYLGIWTLICFVFQACFAWLVLGLMTQNRWMLIFSCVIFVFTPPMLWRVNQHTALVAHFMILAAFYLIVSPGRKAKEWSKDILWALLLSAAVLTHFSLFVIVAALWAANLVDEIVFAKLDRLANIKNSVLQALCIGLLAAFLMWQAGYFEVSSSSGSLGGYGFFRMNLLSPFDSKGWSYIMRALPLPSDYGEGYMYFGIGLLLLWPFAFYKFARDGNLRYLLKKEIFKHLFLTLALIALALFAITNHIAIGRIEFGFRISDSIYAVASIFRASGRFFWPMFYALNFACIFIIMIGYSKRFALILLGVACFLQVVDTSAGWRMMRQQIYNPAKNIPHELNLNNSFWDQAAKHYQEVQLVPPQDKASGWDQIALYAAKHQLATNSVFFARVDVSKLSKAQENFMNGLYRSSWKPGTLYVLQPDMALPAYFHSNPNADLLVGFDGFAVLAPNWKNCKDCPVIEENLRSELNQITKEVQFTKSLGFNKGELGTRFLIDVGGSWAWPEAWGVWSNGNQAKMILPVPQSNSSTSAKQLKLTVRAFISPLHPKQNIEVFVDRMSPQATSLSDPNVNIWVINLPPNVDKKKYIELQFHFMNPARPKDVAGVPGDDRRLGMGIISAQFM
ncbi:DUF6311 domain-containing protein [Polynucleobacter sp. IMCC 29146]|uniref:DUF6311 domain-containing protein n=1 Tax=Polynucleobacter sp. IMCC 29146 TaxID=2780953 RepID=UPI001F243985|nr:DUF6311 domain-containing protein [Polynucleobacter sp. IMCC 29146]MCE7530520.1 DUF6311 domain-containing protein [Polynucleobacter sp. IMCC 29146]